MRSAEKFGFPIGGPSTAYRQANSIVCFALSHPIAGPNPSVFDINGQRLAHSLKKGAGDRCMVSARRCPRPCKPRPRKLFVSRWGRLPGCRTSARSARIGLLQPGGDGCADERVKFRRAPNAGPRSSARASSARHFAGRAGRSRQYSRHARHWPRHGPRCRVRPIVA